MPCYKPLKAYQVLRGATRPVSFTPPKAEYRLLDLPCGQCMGCRVKYGQNFAIRMMGEASLYEQNCFLTLTYDEEHCPSDWSLSKDVLQRFLKRYRFECGKLRYYGVGEYGESNFRPHYHLAIFGHNFDDRISCDLRTDYPLFVSPTLNKLWPFGNARIGELTYESAAYVASYVTKKITGEKAATHYNRVLESTGECVDVEPEFALMSRNLGLGWYSKFHKEVYPLDRVVSRGRQLRPPRAFDKLLAKHDPDMLDRVKLAREEKLNSSCNSYSDWLESVRRLPQREEFAKLRQKTFSDRNKRF